VAVARHEAQVKARLDELVRANNWQVLEEYHFCEKHRRFVS
jgi:hypothetical protein